MAQKTSTASEKKQLVSGTESLIRKAYQSSSSLKIAIRPEFLDDEKLPEAERVSVLREVFHRNIRLRQIERLARALSPVLGNELPSNLLVYGPSGAGKSVTCLHFLAALSSMCLEKGVVLQYFYLDLTTPHTCFGAFNELAIALDGATRRYKKGIPIDSMQESIVASLQELSGFVCIVVDEADNVTTGADLFLTFLSKTLPKKVPVRLFYVLLTNRLEWEKTLDPRILAVLKKQDVIFEPYDAMDLVEILKLRVEKALVKAKVDAAAVRKIAAYASRETGDARKAVELLAKAVKVAEETTGRLSEPEVDAAERILEVDKTEELIGSLAVQQKLALRACYLGLSRRPGRLSTGDAFQVYLDVCDRAGVRPLTQRRFSDMVSFLDVYGLVSAPVISKGRYGKTRLLSGCLPSAVVKELLR
jgi:cell division control protein 6